MIMHTQESQQAIKSGLAPRSVTAWTVHASGDTYQSDDHASFETDLPTQQRS
jgi:hypothetical protein